MSAPLKLITETTFNDSLIVESKNGELYIEGIFLQADVKNHNERIYPLSILEAEVQAYKEEYIDTSRAIGELNHPESATVNPERASHLIVKIDQDGSNFIGKAKILNTPQGNIVRGLLEGGVKMGVSSRGLGSVEAGKGKYRGIDVVQDDYKLITVDIVSNPSAPDAFVKGIYESMEFMINNGRISPYIPAKKILKKVERIVSKKKSNRLDMNEQFNQLNILLQKL